ncbi:GGDEF domain-containing protein [Mycolicibacterium hippocampi]|uniref:GGDEF domain-containing protein n=1 Tax=Mycolicibacterium hippocampi TaxID=659824 RepID=UPI003515853C
MGAIRRWWGHPDQYDWLSSYMHARGFSRSAQILMAVVAASGALVPANAFWSPVPANLAVLIPVAVIAGVAGLSYCVLWLTRWPTRIQSIGFASFICLSIGLGSWAAADPRIGLMACAALAVSGGYFAFFHSAPLVAANLAVALVVAAVHVAALAAEGELVLALTMFFLVIELNAGVPLAIQVMVHALGIDLIKSDRDPLTGLFNRRSFQRAVVARVLDGQPVGSYLAFAMIDLDRFKALNDTYGHTTGDDALVAVGRALCTTLPKSAIVGRVGGEEFLAADIIATPVAENFGEQARAAITTTGYGLTGSVGTAAVEAASLNSGTIVDSLHWLTVEADVAMYTAKRAGGNQVHHHGPLEAPRRAPDVERIPGETPQ